MSKRMLIDATHPEETRVVVVDGHRLEELDFESASKKQLKGNIYLARVTRVEPSLQAAFVEYGGNRHGFLAFNEIHPDYWRIPIADRQALLAQQQHDDDDEPQEPRPRRNRRRQHDNNPPAEAAPPPADAAAPGDTAAATDNPPPIEAAEAERAMPLDAPAPSISEATFADPRDATPPNEPRFDDPREASAESLTPPPLPVPPTSDTVPPAIPVEPAESGEIGGRVETVAPHDTTVESLGGDDIDDEDAEEEVTRRRMKRLRNYKIQEVIQRKQVLLVQVVKEERGNKGAALTTYLSLPGRFCVLMPNTARGGGISRRITSQQDRKRLKSIMDELDVPDGMAAILRTAGMERSKEEIRRDYLYLMDLWSHIRELTLKSHAPALIYEEGNLIKRAIRDLYSSDVEEIQVEGGDGYRVAREFMRALMPAHVEKIKLYDEPVMSLFQRHQVEAQLDDMHSNTVRLRSGGYIVINLTEALVAIDVNSGRATRERHIEETAFKTNMEAAEEIARQIRLRDLAGLIVIDFIDMEENRAQHAVERRLKEAMKSDRARIQIGRISPFGLLELSRQRLRPSLLEVSSDRCPHCEGSGYVRSTESSALHVLRGIEEDAMKHRASALTVRLPAPIALYLLNHKRPALAAIEARCDVRVGFEPDATLIAPAFRIEHARMRPSEIAVSSEPVRQSDFAQPGDEAVDRPIEAGVPPMPGYAPPPADGAAAGEDGDRRRRRRRRRRGRRGEVDGPIDQPALGGAAPNDDEISIPPPGDVPAPVATAAPAVDAPGEGPAGPEGEDGDRRRRRRRGRRGGRRRHGEDGVPPPVPAVGAPPPGHVLIGPGHDLDRPFLERPEGPGDEHDWPWNRAARSETPPPIPTMDPAEPPPIAAPQAVTPPPLPPIIETPHPEPMAAPEPPPAAVEPPPPPEPAGPPRRGWWKRITS